MKYEGKRKSGKDKDIDVYNFVFGIEELRTLHKVIIDVRNRLPKIFETNPLRNRLGNMCKVLEKFQQEEKKKF